MTLQNSAIFSRSSSGSSPSGRRPLARPRKRSASREAQPVDAAEIEAAMGGEETEAGVAAAEAAIGLAIIVIYYRNKGSIRVEDIHGMKG